ncbi:hypothetical protein Esti_001082 [Eimeria stiedai]
MSAAMVPQHGRQNVCLCFPRLSARRRWSLACASFSLMALLPPSSSQEPFNAAAEQQKTFPMPFVIPEALLALMNAPDSETSSDPAVNPTLSTQLKEEESAQLPTALDSQLDVGSHANSAAQSAPLLSPVASVISNIPHASPMTVTIIIGASETVKDCSQEAHSQSFLMTLARRFQQLQLLPILVAIGQQSVRVVTSQGRLQTPPSPSAAARTLEPDSLLLHRYSTSWGKPQPMMLVEVAAKTPLLQQRFWRAGGGLRARGPGLWGGSPDGIVGDTPHERSLVRQSTPQLVPQSQVFRNETVQSQLRGILGDLQQPSASAALTQLGGSFVGGLMYALEATPLVRVNLGDMACAALPTSAFSRKLSCWLLRAFADRILCRTAWFDPCQALSDQAAHGNSLLSPVVLPAGGPDTLALPLKQLVSQRRSLSKKTPRDVVMKEGPTYQLIWQALTRLDDMWALAYCGRDIPIEPLLHFKPDPKKPQATSQRAEAEPKQPEQQKPSPQKPQETRRLQDSSPAPGMRGSPIASSGADMEAVEPQLQQSQEEGVEARKAQNDDTAAVPRHSVSPDNLDADIPHAASASSSAEDSSPPSTNPSSPGAPSSADGSQSESQKEEYFSEVPAISPGDLLPGWRTELILKALSPGIENRTNVLAVVGRRGTEVLIAFRGTKTQVEWILNGQAEHAFRWLPEGEGRTAAGFSHIFSSAWPALQVYLASVNKPESPLTRILVTGYSLGGAVAALMSYGIALNYPMKVDAVLFGSPRTGDAAFAAAWAKKVNGRSVSFSLDPIPRTPCREMPACDKQGMRGPLTLPNNFLKWATTSPRVAGNSGTPDGFTPTNGYGDMYGLVHFGPEELGGSSRGKGNPVYVSYNHICSYPCWLATNFNPRDRRTLCELPDPAFQWSPSLTPDTYFSAFLAVLLRQYPFMVDVEIAFWRQAEGSRAQQDGCRCSCSFFRRVCNVIRRKPTLGFKEASAMRIARTQLAECWGEEVYQVGILQ